MSTDQIFASMSVQTLIQMAADLAGCVNESELAGSESSTVDQVRTIEQILVVALSKFAAFSVATWPAFALTQRYFNSAYNIVSACEHHRSAEFPALVNFNSAVGEVLDQRLGIDD